MKTPAAKKNTTREPQYQRCLDVRREYGLTPLGLSSNQTWHDDPKHLLFVLSRYKFVAKMFSGRNRVLEVGCGDAFYSRVVLQEVGELTVTDFDPVFIRDVRERMDKKWKFEAKVNDILKKPVSGSFDGIYSLDVLEHIPRDNEERFMRNVCHSLKDTGELIVGMPSLESQKHASALSKQGHVNCKDHQGMRSLLSRFFRHVFIFSMNDEVVHTGFYPMAHYFLALCCGKKTFSKNRG